MLHRVCRGHQLENQKLATKENGVLDAEAAFAGPPEINSEAVTIGIHGTTLTDTHWPAKGIIDEVCLFDVALTEEQIESIMTKGLKAVGVAAIEPESKLSTTWASIKFH